MSQLVRGPKKRKEQIKKLITINGCLYKLCYNPNSKTLIVYDEYDSVIMKRVGITSSDFELLNKPQD